LQTALVDRALRAAFNGNAQTIFDRCAVNARLGDLQKSDRHDPRSAHAFEYFYLSVDPHPTAAERGFAALQLRDKARDRRCARRLPLGTVSVRTLGSLSSRYAKAGRLIAGSKKKNHDNRCCPQFWSP
jgi:hypothetical protein